MRAVVAWLAMLVAGHAAQAELRVVTTTSDLASIAEFVGGDHVEVEAIVDGRDDVHAVEVLPSHMLKLRRADLFVQIGLELELWAPAIVRGARNRDLALLDCSVGIERLKIPTVVDAAQGDIHTQGNPHYWLDPANGHVIARNLTRKFKELDASHAPQFDGALAAFSARLDEAIARWKAMVAPHADTKIVFFHDSWPYFTRAFGFRESGFIEPKPGVTPSPGHTTRLIERIRSEQIPIVAIASHYDDRLARRIAREGGAEFVVLATSVGGIEGADDYFGLFDANLARLVEAIERRR